jgi:hypothetical protein
VLDLNGNHFVYGRRSSRLASHQRRAGVATSVLGR